ncbi:MAG: flippase [Pirellulales bacterium]
MATVSAYNSDRTAQRVLNNAAWLVFGRIARLTIGVAVSVWVARYLRPADFGLLASAIALVSILSVVGRLGMNPIVVRDLVRQPESARDLLGTILAIRVMSAVIGLATAIFVGWFYFGNHEAGTWLFVLVGLSLLPQSFFRSLELWFQSQINAKPLVVIETTSFVVTAAARIAMLAAGASLIYFATIPLLTAIFSALGLAWVLRSRMNRIITFKPNLTMAGNLLRDNWSMMLSQVAGIIYLRIDQLMLATMKGTSDAGIYAAALRISEVWYFMPAAICISLKPALTRLRDNNRERYLQVLQGMFSTMTALALVVAIPITFLAAPAVDFLYGADYAAAAPVLVIHIWTALFVFWKRAQSEWLINDGYLKFGLCRALLGAVTNIALNAILIPQYGPIGAATATLVSCFVSVVPVNLLFAPARPILRMQLRSLLLIGLGPTIRQGLGRPR